MKKIIFTIFFSLLFSSYCFSASKTSNDKMPDWVNNTGSMCAKNEICATGNGTTQNMAKTDARNNILKYFETKVSSQFRSNLSTDETTVQSSKYEDMDEISEGILKGVSIKNTYQSNGEYFAFAVLNKDVAAKEIRSDIDKADSKMQLLIAENNIKYNKQLEQLYLKREELNKRYLVLTGNMVPEIVKYEDIFNAKKKSGELSLVYYINESEGFGEQVAEYLSSIIIENGAKVVNKKDKANRIINLVVNIKKLHSNVSGFAKQSYILTLEVVNKNGDKVAKLYKEFNEAGRGESHIRELVNAQIQTYLFEHMEDILQ